MFNCAAQGVEGTVAVLSKITSGLGSCHRALRQQLGLLHAVDLPA